MRNLVVVSLLVSLAAGCMSTTRVDNEPGRRTVYDDPSTPGRVIGVGIESQDIVSITDEMVRDILAAPAVAGRSSPPRVVVDAYYFRNESSSTINKNLFTDLLRTQLNRAATGRLVFLAREHAGMTEKERALEEEGVVTGGTQGATKPAYGYDYRLGGRIASLDAIDRRTGLTSRYHQVTFELVERGSGVIVWSKTCQFKKTARDDEIYR
jgi:hypothetical protein